MSAPQRLDLKGLPPPEPLLRALEAVALLPPGEELALVTERRPVHLLALLPARGCVVREAVLPDGHETVVRKEGSAEGSG